MTARISYPLLLAAFFLTGTVSLFGQIEMKLQLMPDGKTYGAYARPDESINPGTATITGSGQVTVVMPAGLAWHSLTSVHGQWTNNTTVVAPPENPTRSYYQFGLQAAEPTFPIPYKKGKETLLFTFAIDCVFPDTMYLIDCNAASGVTDSYCPDFPDATPGTNSQNSNPGCDLSVVDFGVYPTGFYYYKDNYAHAAWNNHDADGDGVPNAFEDTNGNGVFDLGIDDSDLRDFDDNGVTLHPSDTITLCGNGPVLIIGDVSFENLYYPLTYFWEYSSDNGVTWDSLENSQNIGGANADTLLIVDAEAYQNHLFRMLISIGCIDFYSNDVFLQLLPPPLPVTVNIDQVSCSKATLTALYPGNADSYAWNVNGTSEQITVTEPGLYFVTVTDEDGCRSVDTVTVAFDIYSTCATISGNILQDTTGNCLSGQGMSMSYDWLIEAIGNDVSYYGMSDTDGSFSIPVEPGNYTLIVHPASNVWLPCENAIPVMLEDIGDTVNVDFLVEKLIDCPRMKVDITSNRLRRCSENYYYVRYQNDGTFTAEDAYVKVSIDPELEFQNATMVYTALGNNQYHFDIGDVAPGEWGKIYIRVKVPCDVAWGITHCTEAFVFPDDLCLPSDPDWTGASLEVEATCQDSVRFKIKNTGYGSMSDPVSYLILQDNQIYLYQQQAPLTPGASAVVSLPADGSTWRIEVDQVPLHPLYTQDTATMEGCDGNTGGDISTGFVDQMPMGDEADFIDMDCRPNVGSYDPNDKAASPSGYGEAHFIASDTDIEYRIRFQNSGTDTAFKVVLLDTLANLLDLSTLRPGASSHPYEIDIYGNGILKVNFPDIKLPQEAIDEPGSQGFFSFKISLKDNLIPLTTLENTAYIYFDYNPPIQTNTTLHTIEKPVVHSFQSVELCENENWNGQVFTTDTMIVETIEFIGYDSMVWTEIRVRETVETELQATICEGESYIFYNKMLTASGTYNQAWQTASGCDSTVYLTLEVIPNSVNFIAAGICAGNSYLFSGEELTSPGEYQAVFTASNGCDSIIELSLSVFPPVETSLDVEICKGSTYLFNGQEIGEPGVYEATDTSATGCDSTILLHLTVVNEITESLEAEICEGDTYWLGNEPIHQAGAYEQFFTSVSGCDSIVYLILAVKEDVEELVDASICEGRSYEFGGEELSEPGKYMHTYSDGACDSTVVLNLSVLPSYDLTIEETVEAGGTFHGVPVFSDTTFKESHLSVHGCDSIVTTHVKVATPVKNSLQEAIGMEVFPNPAGEKVNIRFNLPQASRGKIRILDVVGRQVQFDSGESRYESGKHSFEIETREWPAGMYLVQLQLENEWAMAKLVVR